MMKKSLVALAVLAAAGAASAQSSVTLFGIVDASIAHYTVKSSYYSPNLFALPPLTTPVGAKRSVTGMYSNNYNSSRLGFRGVEDLGGGLAASFWLESPLSNDDGVTGLGSFSRRSTVSLSGGFGEIRLGRDYVATFSNDSAFDPFGTNGAGTNIISSINGNLHGVDTGSVSGFSTTAASNYVRASNMVGYFLPPNLGGFYGQVQYAFHENVKFSDTAGSPSKARRYVGGRFGYANGPLDVAAAYGVSTSVDATTTTAAGTFTGNAERKIKSANLGASYDFGVVKLFGEVSRVKDDNDFSTGTPLFGAVTTGFSDKYTGYNVGVHVPVGAGLIRASVGKVKFKADVPFVIPTLFGNSNFDASANKIALGYVHNLSKRTALYTTVARVRVKDGQNNPYVMGAVVGGFSGNTATSANGYLSTGNYAPRTSTGYEFGIRHSF